MLFNSIEYFLFFTIVVIIYYILPFKFRWILLLAASVFFYMYLAPSYIILAAVIALNDFSAAKLMVKFPLKKKIFLWQSLIIDLGILFTFKYFNFFSVNITKLSELIGWNYSPFLLEVLLPAGLSFYIFKSISYTFDVYRDNYKAENNIGKYFLFIIFFPEVLSGPIDRASNLLPQFNEKKAYDYSTITSGLILFAWGLFKKVVIADRLAAVVNPIFNEYTKYSGIPNIISFLFFPFQIYCDFSGYTDMALGSGLILGYKLLPNFNKPYFSQSISDFWRRWHMSLSFWLRDYIFLPIAYSSARYFSKLKGFKVDKWSYIVAVSITFFITGLWHGAGWNYIFWGCLMGFYLIFGMLTKSMRRKFLKKTHLIKSPLVPVLRIIFTFLLVSIAWVFFRSESFSQAVYILTHMFNVSMQLTGYHIGGSYYPIPYFRIFFPVILIILLLIIEKLQKDMEVQVYIKTKPIWLRWVSYYILILLIIIFNKADTSGFIYTNF